MDAQGTLQVLGELFWLGEGSQLSKNESEIKLPHCLYLGDLRVPVGLTGTGITHAPAGCWHPPPTQTPSGSADFCQVPKKLPPPKMLVCTAGSQGQPLFPADLASA